MACSTPILIVSAIGFHLTRNFTYPYRGILMYCRLQYVVLALVICIGLVLLRCTWIYFCKKKENTGKDGAKKGHRSSSALDDSGSSDYDTEYKR